MPALNVSLVVKHARWNLHERQTAGRYPHLLSHNDISFEWSVYRSHNREYYNATAPQKHHTGKKLVFAGVVVVGSDFSKQLDEEDASYAFNWEFVKGLDLDPT